MSHYSDVSENDLQEESQESEDMVSTVVFDLGSHTCKVGYASSNFPEAVVPSIVGMPKYNGKISRELCNQDEIYVGMDVFPRCALLGLKHPIEQGIVIDWDEFEVLMLNILS